MKTKRALAVYWASGCGGCEIAIANLHEHLLDLDDNFHLVFCPCLVDTKTRDIRGLPDGSIDLTLFNGAIRNEENEEMAHLLRRKSKLMVAYGSCAAEGCIPSLSNLSSREEHFRVIYLDNPSLDNPNRVVPRETTEVPEGTLGLPRLYERAKTLRQTVDVDYLIPGCPPESQQVWNVLDLFIRNSPLPAKGSVIGAGRSSVCRECSRTRQDKALTRIRRTFEIVPDRESCLLDQGILCMGVATRDGCGALCPQANMPCIGCYGPPEGILDQGAAIAGTLGSIFDIERLKGLPADEINRQVDSLLESMPDLAGSFYRFSLAGSLLKGAVPRMPREEK
jgi:F420-non-reducing hydrogenase small subunit